MPVKVLFVCLGNICRSPTAEGVFTHQLREAGLLDLVSVDSAGTGHWHVGKAPDSRAIAAAASRAYDISRLRARQVDAADFTAFDYVLAMDEANLDELRALCPEDFSGHLGLFLNFAAPGSPTAVPDPYYGGAAGFDEVLDLVEAASAGLLQDIRGRLKGAPV